jgi:hypothetical protein
VDRLADIVEVDGGNVLDVNPDGPDFLEMSHDWPLATHCLTPLPSSVFTIIRENCGCAGMTALDGLSTLTVRPTAVKTLSTRISRSAGDALPKDSE